MLKWANSVNTIKSHIVKITTPNSSGTGFLISSAPTANLCAVATAAHVIHHAHYWEEPIRIFHQESENTVLFTPKDRVILVDIQHDTAAIIFPKKIISFPDTPLGMTTEGKYIKIGYELGWIGYPALSPTNLCLFSGRASCWLENESAYLVDGVAINGVSGGPAFLPLTETSVIIVGVVSAYIPNRATGDTLPGLCVIQDVKQFHDISKRFKSIEEAKKKETPPIPPKIEGQNRGEQKQDK